MNAKRATGGVYLRGEVYWCHYRVDGVRYYESCDTSDRRAAQAYLASVRRSIAAGEWRPPRERGAAAVLTVAAYFDAWFARRRAAGVINVACEEQRMRVHVVPVIGALALGDVTRPQIRDLIAKVSATKCARVRKGETEPRMLAPRSVIGTYRTLCTAFADARDDGLIAATPCTLRTRRGELPRKTDRDPAWRATSVYSRDELERLLGDERVPADRRTYYALQLLGGMRAREAAGRRWRDYDRGASPLGRLTVGSQANDRHTTRGTKTGESRVVPVVPALARILDDWRRVGFPMFFGRHPQDGDPIVPSRERDGDAYRFRDAKNALTRLQEDLVRVGLRTVPSAQHAMRATFLSLLESAGANMAIARRATHAAPSDVVGGYIRTSWADLCREIAKLDVEPQRVAKVIELPRVVASSDVEPATVASVEAPSVASVRPLALVASSGLDRGPRGDSRGDSRSKRPRKAARSHGQNGRQMRTSLLFSRHSITRCPVLGSAGSSSTA